MSGHGAGAGPASTYRFSAVYTRQVNERLKPYGLSRAMFGKDFAFIKDSKSVPNGINVYMCSEPSAMNTDLQTQIAQHSSFTSIKKGKWDQYAGGYACFLIAKTKIIFGAPSINPDDAVMTKSANFQ